MINLTKEEYDELRRVGKLTNEGYILPNPHNCNQIIKVIEPKPTAPEYLPIKKHTIKRLLENYDYISGLKIVLPQEGVAIEGDQRAYTTEKITGIELACALSYQKVPVNNKISWLKQIGALLRNMKDIRYKYPHLSNFYYNDMHERNFIVTEEGIVYGIDPDSFSIQDNIPVRGMYSMYLNQESASGYKKYHSCISLCDYTTNIIPDENLDLYCYIRMILNFMAGKQLSNFNLEMFHNYLNYLESHGANLELLYCLSSIHNDSIDNINPDYLLDYIKEIYQYSNCRYDETGELRRILR